MSAIGLGFILLLFFLWAFAPFRALFPYTFIFLLIGFTVLSYTGVLSVLIFQYF